MIKIKKIGVSLTYTILVFTTISCVSNRVKFTQPIRNNITNSWFPLSRLQYYVNKTIVLEREVADSELLTIKSGKIKLKEGRIVNTIILNKNTPLKCNTNINGYDLYLSIEEDKPLLFKKNNNFEYKLVYADEYLNGKDKNNSDKGNWKLKKGLNATLLCWDNGYDWLKKLR